MVSDLLTRLAKVKPSGRGQWMALCPAHEDGSPSLAVRELDDGMVLVHCFAGCPVDAVVGAVGLELGDLYADSGRRGDRTGPGRGVGVPLRAVAHEALVVAMAASRMARGGVLSDDDRARLMVAADRLQRAAGIAGGG